MNLQIQTQSEISSIERTLTLNPHHWWWVKVCTMAWRYSDPMIDTKDESYEWGWSKQWPCFYFDATAWGSKLVYTANLMVNSSFVSSSRPASSTTLGASIIWYNRPKEEFDGRWPCYSNPKTILHYSKRISLLQGRLWKQMECSGIIFR